MNAPEHRTWEYRTTSARSAPELNRLGADGWELIGILDGELYFKRPGLSFKERVTLAQREHYYATLHEAPIGDELP